jgi:uncharacterized protein
LPLTAAEGRLAVLLARETVEAHVMKREAANPEQLPPVFSEKRGVFVTLSAAREGSKSLRGCIGYPEPIKPLAEAIRDVAVHATEDSRFPFPVRPEELDHIAVEVSVLTLPRELTAARRETLPSKLKLGVDGLIVSNSFTSGLFLPQVATEQGWDQETFISEACGKAGLPFDAWLEGSTRVEVFQAEVFGEEEPRGKVVRMDPEASR